MLRIVFTCGTYDVEFLIKPMQDYVVLMLDNVGADEK